MAGLRRSPSSKLPVPNTLSPRLIRHGEEQNALVRLIDNDRQIRERVNGNTESLRAGNTEGLEGPEGT